MRQTPPTRSEDWSGREAFSRLLRRAGVRAVERLQPRRQLSKPRELHEFGPAAEGIGSAIGMASQDDSPFVMRGTGFASIASRSRRLLGKLKALRIGA
jgi:hypothetical protein